MLQIHGINYFIGQRELLKDIHWNIHPGRRIALIGPNGAGKTTLMRILIGELAPESGQITKPREFRIGYLPQEEIEVGFGSILEGVLEGFRDLLRMEQEMTELQERLAHEPHDKELLQRMGDLQHKYEASGGYELEANAKNILSGLGFSISDFQRPLADFSGGWRMRVYLARLLLLKPDLLLLDEPTNHLDLTSLEWLEQYLLTFPGGMVLISHDRFFIERLADEIAELEFGKLVHYSGHYRYYEQQKALQAEQLLARWRSVREERERQQKFIDRFRYKATKAAQVQSRIKQLEKMEQVELPPAPPKISFTLRVEEPSYKQVLAVKNLWFRYETDWVLQDIDLDLYREEKIALVGVNGAGKTTLTRLMTGQLQPQQGEIEAGGRTRIGYYAQHQVETLNLNATVYDEVASSCAVSLAPNVRDVLGIFQFHGDDVFKPVRVLSGGEKARVSLAKMLLSPVNFLIMDEPTNHLDMASRKALETALKDYDGTLVLISHDRYFLDKLVTRVFEIRDHRLRVFEGNYSEYLSKRQQIEQAASMQESPDKPAGGPARLEKEQKRIEAEARQAISKDRQKWSREIDFVENRIAELELRKEQIEKDLGNPETYKNGDLAAGLQREYTAVKQEITERLEQWEAAQMALQSLLQTLKKS